MAGNSAARAFVTLEQIACRSGLNAALLHEIRDIAIRCGLAKLVLFGSRARGDYDVVSDIDLACSGGRTAEFALDVDEDTSTPLRFDVVDLGKSLSSEFRASIEKDCLEIPLKKYQTCLSILPSLEQAVSALARHADPEDPDHSVVLSGIMNMFARQAELGVKALDEMLRDVDGVRAELLRTPRAVINEACAAYPNHINEDLWAEMLTQRNRVTSIYSEKLVQELVDTVVERYLPALRQLQQLLLDVYCSDMLPGDASLSPQP